MKLRTMDATVNDFLNEINEIAPLTENKPPNHLWEECYDKDSGYYYYWNTKTDEVTWTAPTEYKSMKETIKQTKKSNTLYIPPRTAPLFPSAMLPPVSEAVKIYKISDNLQQSQKNKTSLLDNESKAVCSTKAKKCPQVDKKLYKASNDSDDEKIVLISSYGGDTESEEEDEVDIKTENKQVNGLPKSDKQTKEPTQINLDTTKKIKTQTTTTTNEISGLLLVAGYTDSEDEELDEIELKKCIDEEPKISHSTLFPITKPIDLNDFTDTTKTNEKLNDSLLDKNFDNKAFQRKKRIGVALINTGKKIKINDDNNERKGFGFKTDNNNESKNITSSSSGGDLYSGFQSGGVMFVKSDILNPVNNTQEKIETNNEIKITNNIEEIYKTLKEKLGFLSEGKEAVSPVQVMLIQSEILFAAVKTGDLKQNYLSKWLNDTCSELIKLEKETTPDGWLLQWDRSHKRYYYQNETTGECQWEYPQPDVTRCDEAMDICTTPPPPPPSSSSSQSSSSSNEQTNNLSPSLPTIKTSLRSPSPPPPPIISDFNSQKKSQKKKRADNAVPSEPNKDKVLSDKYDSNGQPLPPGVDVLEESEEKKDDLTNELDSFYSDIAALENSKSPPQNLDVKNEPENMETTKKKKKAKVKLAQGIGMKKKGVSKLVEKWKNVQMSYKD